MITQSDQIKFAVPIDIFKGKNSKGENTYVFEGIASTPDTDTQGETLFTKAYDLNNFKDVNWNHKSKDDANAYLGQIVSHNFEKSGLKIKGELFEEMPMTNAVVNLMKALKKRGKKLQLSVEGQVLQRGSENKDDPAYKIIKKAKLTGVAITNNAINQNTFCDLIEKGYTNNDWQYDPTLEPIMKSLDSGIILTEEEIEKAMQAGSISGTETLNKELTAEPLKAESVEGAKTTCNCKKVDCPICNTANKKVLSKSLVFEKIFNYFYPIDFEKANQVYKLAEKISIMEKNKGISEETLRKSFEIIDLAASSNQEQELEKGKKVEATIELKAEPLNDDIQKSLEILQLQTEDMQSNVDLKMGAIGVILKSQTQMIESLMDSNEMLQKSNEALIEKLDAISAVTEKISKTPISKTNLSALKGVERFEKSEDGMTTYNLNNPVQKKALADKLEQLSGFPMQHLNGGRFNEELMKAAGDIELIGAFGDAQVPQYLEDVHKIKVVKA